MAGLKQLWRESLLCRRVTAAIVFVVAALLVNLGSHISRRVTLPKDDLSAMSIARIGEEQIVIKNPEIGEGDVALSYEGSKDEVADLWLANATLDAQSQHLLFAGTAGSEPGRISYTTGEAAASASGVMCRTTIVIRRAKGSPAIEALKLYQTDATAGAQRFRQVVLDAGNTPMNVEVHTDSSAADLSGCRKLLTIGGAAPIDMPSIPVHMVVRSGKIDLHFNQANPAVPISTGEKNTFEGVSLGDSSLRAKELQVVSMIRSKSAALAVRSSPGSDEITLSRLKIGSDKLMLDVGHYPERAVAYANGAPIYTYDLMAAIQKNPFLGYGFAAVLLPGLWLWIKKTCFPVKA